MQANFTPICYEDGDVILRCGDVDFLVHMFMLKQASPFFRTLFSLPQPNALSITADGQSGGGPATGASGSVPSTAKAPPVIRMEEEPLVLDKLLRWIYPIRGKPFVSTIEEAKAISRAAEKLDIECAIDPINQSLTGLLQKEPNALRSWALAFMFKHDQARLAAAIRFIKITPNTLLPRVGELASISALEYADLLHLRQEAHNLARKAMQYEYSSWWGCKSCCKDAYGNHVQGKEDSCPEWYLNYLEKVAGRNPLTEDVSSDGLVDACIASSRCEPCKTWYDSLAVKYRPAVIIRNKLSEVHAWIAKNASVTS